MFIGHVFTHKQKGTTQAIFFLHNYMCLKDVVACNNQSEQVENRTYVNPFSPVFFILVGYTFYARFSRS